MLNILGITKVVPKFGDLRMQYFDLVRMLKLPKVAVS